MDCVRSYISLGNFRKGRTNTQAFWLEVIDFLIFSLTSDCNLLDSGKNINVPT